MSSKTNNHNRYINPLREGEKVVMHSCMESQGVNLGKIWECRSDSFQTDAGEEVVFLKGFSGYFLCKYLQPVRLDDVVADF